MGEGLVQGDVQRRRDELRDLVDLGVGDVEHPAHVADGRLGRHRAERNDLGHVVGAVFLGDVLDHFPAPIHAEVHVDVGEAHALGVEKSLEDQSIADGIDVGDLQRVRHETARRGTAPRAHGNAVGAGVVDDVPHDEEVPGVPHRVDHRELVPQTLFVERDHRGGGAQGGEPFLQPRDREPLQVILAGRTFGHRVVRQVERVEIEFQVAPLGDFDGLEHRRRQLAEEPRHFLRGFDVQLLGREPHALRILERFAGLQAEQDVVGLGVVAFEVVAVVGRDERDVESAAHVDQVAVHARLLFQPVFLDLDEKIVPAEDVLVGARRPIRLVAQPLIQQERNLAAQAPAGGHETLAVLGEQFLIDPRLVIEALEIRPADQFHEIFVPDLVRGQDDEVVIRGLLALAGGVERIVLIATAVLGEPALGRQIHLAADDGFDPGLLGLEVKLDRPEHVAVIGHRDRRHLERPGLADETVDLIGPIQEAVLRMHVKVDELGAGHAVLCKRLRAYSIGSTPQGQLAPRQGRGMKSVAVGGHFGWRSNSHRAKA